MDKKILLKTLEAIDKKINKEAEYLTELDRKIGDGDHGTNLKRGFNEIHKQLKSLETKDIKDILNACAMILMTKVGGSSGPLLATAFMRMAKENNFADMIIAANEGIKQRGKAIVGEKTMVDVLEPFALEYKKNVDNGLDHCQAIVKALSIAKEKVEYTKTIKATKGRASYLGERSIGTIDPGAQSIYFILETIKESTCND